MPARAQRRAGSEQDGRSAGTVAAARGCRLRPMRGRGGGGGGGQKTRAHAGNPVQEQTGPQCAHERPVRWVAVGRPKPPQSRPAGPQSHRVGSRRGNLLLTAPPMAWGHRSQRAQTGDATARRVPQASGCAARAVVRHPARPSRDPERAQMGSASSGGGCLNGARAKIFGNWVVQTGFKNGRARARARGGLG